MSKRDQVPFCECYLLIVEEEAYFHDQERSVCEVNISADSDVKNE